MYEGFALRKDLKDPKSKEARLARIEEIENETFERASGIVNAFLAFAEVTPQQEEPPEAWVEEFGAEGARQRLMVARAGWLPQAVAPAAAKLGAQMMVGILRGRGYKVRATQNNLNVTLTLPVPTTSEHPGPVVYEVRDVET